MPTPVTPGHPWMNRLLRLLLKLRNRHFLALDILISLLTPTLALWLRTDSLPLVVHGQSLIFVTVVFLAIKLAVFLPFGFYRRYWRYASIDELMLITAGVIQSTLLQTLIFFVILRPLGLIGPGFPRSLPLLDGLLTLALVGVARYGTRIAERLDQVHHGRANTTRTLIVGAGAAGLM
ncbi:MAG: capsule biosynthesis protein CapD, partial [Anaerolineae bacterium]